MQIAPTPQRRLWAINAWASVPRTRVPEARAKGVADCDRSPVTIDDLRVNVPSTHAGKSLGSEGLIQLHAVHILPIDARPLQCLVGGLDGGEAEELRHWRPLPSQRFWPLTDGPGTRRRARIPELRPMRRR